MSFPARRTSPRGGNRPAQVFKKRYDAMQGVSSLANNNATLLAQIILSETGTIYAVKIGAWGDMIAGVSPDAMVNNLYVRCVPNDTLLPDLTDETELATMNGFFVGSYFFRGGSGNVTQGTNTKFRFRRKCDENMQLQLLAQSFHSGGTMRTVEWSGIFEAIIRVR